MTGKRITEISSTDFDGFVAEVAAEIFNQLVKIPAFHTLKPQHYADIFEAVSNAMARTERKKIA